MRNLLWMMLAFLAAGCGEFRQSFGRNEAGTTQVQFALPSDQLHASGVLVRGMMIYMARTDNQFIASLGLSSEDEAATASVTVPNGIYEFFAVGWDGASPFAVSGSGLRCAKRSDEDGNAVALGGGATTVSLVMNNANCELAQSTGKVLYPANAGGSAFSTGTNVNNVKLKMCQSGTTSGTAGSAMSCAPYTSNTTVQLNNRVQVELLSYVRDGASYQPGSDPARKILGSCLLINANSILDLGNVPIGDPNDTHGGIFALRL